MRGWEKNDATAHLQFASRFELRIDEDGCVHASMLRTQEMVLSNIGVHGKSQEHLPLYSHLGHDSDCQFGTGIVGHLRTGCPLLDARS